MADARTEGLRAAADALARVMKRVAAAKTDEGARMVHTGFVSPGVAFVSAGFPVGPYGWNPIQALMFDNNLRHPLFGNKRYWYEQGYYPITDLTVTYGSEDAVQAYADAAVDLMLKEHGILE
jgi:hypothetical protein